MTIELPPPPQLWLPHRPAIIRAGELVEPFLDLATFPFPMFMPPVAAGASTCVWTTSGNPSGLSVTNGGKTATGPITYFARATSGISSGKYYYEVVFTAFGSIPRIGWADSTTTNTSNELGDTGGTISYNPSNGTIRRNGGVAATLPTATTSDRICVAFDYANAKFWIRINNGNWDNTSDNPATNTGGYAVTASGTMYPAVELFGGTTPSVTAYFSSTDWLYGAPSGFSQVP